MALLPPQRTGSLTSRAATPVGRAARELATTPSASGGGLSPPTRAQNVIASRADGSFAAKREAYNAQGAATGHSMDEAGNIIPPSAQAVRLGNGGAGNTSIAPTAQPAGRLIPGTTPGSSIWLPAGQDPKSLDPKTAPPSGIQAPAIARNPLAATAIPGVAGGMLAAAGQMAKTAGTLPLPRQGGLIDGKPAQTVLNGLKNAQLVAGPMAPPRAPAPAAAAPAPVTAAAPVTSPTPSPVTPSNVTAASPVTSLSRPPQAAAPVTPAAPAPGLPSTPGADLAAAKKAAEEAAYARIPGTQKIAQAAVNVTKDAGQMAFDAVNTGIPQAASYVTSAAESAAKAVAAKASEVTAPMRNWLQGSPTKTAAEQKYEEMLKANKRNPPRHPPIPTPPGAGLKPPLAARLPRPANMLG